MNVIRSLSVHCTFVTDKVDTKNTKCIVAKLMAHIDVKTMNAP